MARLVRLTPNVQTKVSQPLDKLAWVGHGQVGKPLGLPAAEHIRLAGDQTLSDLLLKDRE